MTKWFLAHTIANDGWVREVEPKIVLEVAFNAVMESDRHDSGYALRFPRIVPLRDDKSPTRSIPSIAWAKSSSARSGANPRQCERETESRKSKLLLFADLGGHWIRHTPPSRRNAANANEFA
jgi:hypothetical protein